MKECIGNWADGSEPLTFASANFNALVDRWCWTHYTPFDQINLKDLFKTYIWIECFQSGWNNKIHATFRQPHSRAFSISSACLSSVPDFINVKYDVRCGLGTATALLMKNRIGEIHACIAFSAFSLSVPLLHKLSIHLKLFSVTRHLTWHAETTKKTCSLHVIFAWACLWPGLLPSLCSRA